MLRLGGSLAVTSAHLKLVEQGTQRKRGRLAVDEVPEVVDHRHEVAHLRLGLQELRRHQRK